MAVTTPAVIIAKMVQVIEILVPSSPPLDRGFARAPLESRPLRKLAIDGGGLERFRVFDVVRSGPRQEFGPMTDELVVFQRFVVTVAYPPIPDLYGLVSLPELEDLIEQDAHEIRDALFSVNALAADGHLANIPTVNEPDRGSDAVWFQDIPILAKFHAEQKP